MDGDVEINEVKLDMYCAVEAFKGDMREIRERAEWQVRGRHIPLPTQAEQEASKQSFSTEWSAARHGAGRSIGYDGPEDVRRPRDLDPVPGYGASLSQFERARRQEEAAALREHRYAGRVAAAEQRIATRRDGRTPPQQEQGYGHSY